MTDHLYIGAKVRFPGAKTPYIVVSKSGQRWVIARFIELSDPKQVVPADAPDPMTDPAKLLGEA